MCPPRYFTVSYRINPWMHPERPVDVHKASRQWQQLRDKLTSLGHEVLVLDAQPNLPDMVFTANGGIIIGTQAMVPRFRHPERRAESAHFEAAFSALGIDDVRVATHVNEGEGDFRVVGAHILAGTGPRSDARAPAEVADFFNRPTFKLTLVDPRLYHLDTALAVIDDSCIAYWPEAFDKASRDLLNELYPAAIVATDSDATGLGLNLVSDGATVIMNANRSRLAAEIRDRGYTVVPLAMDEFRKSGGGAKCCVLEHHEYDFVSSLRV